MILLGHTGDQTKRTTLFSHVFSYLFLYYIVMSYISNCLSNYNIDLYQDILIILGHIISHVAGEANLGYSFARIKFGPGMNSPLVILPYEKLLYTVPEYDDTVFTH